MKIRVIRKSQQYVQRGEPAPPEEHTDVEIPDGSTCHWEYNNKTVTVRDPAGSSLAAFYNVHTFYDHRVTLTSVDPKSAPNPEGSP